MRGIARLIVIVAVAAACSSAPLAPGETPGPPTPTPTPAPTAAPTPPKITSDCSDELTPLLEALEELDARLDVGLTNNQYGERVGDISVAYNRIDFDRVPTLGDHCLTTAALLENAFNEYISANNRWNDCLRSTSCDTDDIRPQLQADWSSASTAIENARKRFP